MKLMLRNMSKDDVAAQKTVRSIIHESCHIVLFDLYDMSNDDESRAHRNPLHDSFYSCFALFLLAGRMDSTERCGS